MKEKLNFRSLMKKIVFILGLMCLAFSLDAANQPPPPPANQPPPMAQQMPQARPYMYEYHANSYIFIFQGAVTDENMAKAKTLQTKYLESLVVERSTIFPFHVYRGNPYYKNQLEKLGVKIEIIPDHPYIRSENAYPSFN